MSVTAYFKLTAKRARTILAGVETAVATRRDEGEALGITTADLEAFADAFEHSERAAARRAVQ